MDRESSSRARRAAETPRCTTGLIVSLGESILREACRQAAEWRKRFGVGLPVSVNLSGRQLTEPDVVERVARISRTPAFPASCSASR